MTSNMYEYVESPVRLMNDPVSSISKSPFDICILYIDI